LLLVIYKGDDHQPTTCGIPGGKRTHSSRKLGHFRLFCLGMIRACLGLVEYKTWCVHMQHTAWITYMSRILGRSKSRHN